MLVIDNTFMSPVLQSPLALGADVVVHSLTKYIGGHSDVTSGGIMFNDQQLVDKFYMHMITAGNIVSPFDAWLVLRGSKTLALRVRQASENALEIAKWLGTNPLIDKVLYPGLETDPNHLIAKKNAKKQTLSGGGGVLSFYVKGDLEQTNRFLSSLKLITLGVSLGGVESLIESPALMHHNAIPLETR